MSPLSEDDVSKHHSVLSRLFRQEARGLLNYFVRRTAVAEDAADLLSETFLVAWRRSDQCPPTEDELRLWLYGIARRVLSGAHRGRRRREALATRLRTALAETTTAGLDGSHDLSHSELVDDVRRLISDLPSLDREIIGLVYWEGFSQLEVSTIIGRSPSAVRSRLTRVRARLRRSLQPAQEGEQTPAAEMTPEGSLE